MSVWWRGLLTKRLNTYASALLTAVFICAVITMGVANLLGMESHRRMESLMIIAAYKLFAGMLLILIGLSLRGLAQARMDFVNKFFKSPARKRAGHDCKERGCHVTK